MTKFKVGDRVRVGPSADKMWIGLEGVVMDDWNTYTGVSFPEGTCYSDGTPLCPDYIKRSGLSRDNLELIEPDELTQLRQFKADAIAKYPDLAPMSEEDQFVLALYNSHYDMSYKSLSETADAFDIITALRKAIQWGREHA